MDRRRRGLVEIVGSSEQGKIRRICIQ